MKLPYWGPINIMWPQNLATQATWHMQFVHPLIMQHLVDWPCQSESSLPTLGKVIKSTLCWVIKDTIIILGEHPDSNATFINVIFKEMVDCFLLKTYSPTTKNVDSMCSVTARQSTERQRARQRKGKKRKTRKRKKSCWEIVNALSMCQLRKET